MNNVRLKMDATFWMLLIVSCFLFSPLASAKQQETRSHVAVAIDHTSAQVYCDSYTTVPKKQLQHLLEEGAIVSTSWQFSIQRQRDYWLNANINSTELILQVTPDLISKSWTLLNINTGRSQTTRSLARALEFLLFIHHVPVMDEQLLQQQASERQLAQARYELRARIYFQEGVINTAWWLAPLRLGKTVGIQEFSLP